MPVLSTPAADAAFVLDGVGFSFGPGADAVAGVSATVPGGKLTVVLGPNGAGKSVLLSLLAGLRTPTAGRVDAASRLEGGASREWARFVAWVPHQTHGGESFLVREMVAMGRVMRGEPAAATRVAVARALARMELDGLADAPVGTLSSGQRRRVMLARALAQVEGFVGAVLLLDEPDANLDPAQAVFLFRKLSLLLAEGLTVVAVVHDLHLAAEFADEAWLMQDGQLMAAGAAAEVLTEENLSRVYGVRVGAGMGWRIG